MGSNYFIIPKRVAEKYWRVLREIRQIQERIAAVANDIENLDIEPIDSDEILRHLRACNSSCDMIIAFDGMNGVIHIGRRTNNLFIWNIDPNELKQYWSSGDNLIVHETWSEPEDSTYETYESFMTEVVGNCTYDLEHVGKNVLFR